VRCRHTNPDKWLNYLDPAEHRTVEPAAEDLRKREDDFYVSDDLFSIWIVATPDWTRIQINHDENSVLQTDDAQVVALANDVLDGRVPPENLAEFVLKATA
jgi:hypothetical protein